MQLIHRRAIILAHKPYHRDCIRGEDIEFYPLAIPYNNPFTTQTRRYDNDSIRAICYGTWQSVIKESPKEIAV